MKTNKEIRELAFEAAKIHYKGKMPSPQMFSAYQLAFIGAYIRNQKKVAAQEKL